MPNVNEIHQRVFKIWGLINFNAKTLTLWRKDERTNVRTNERTYERTDERKSKNYIPTHTSYVGGIISKNQVKLCICAIPDLSVNTPHYCPFDISWKDLFCLAFYFKWKSLFWQTISYQKPFVFSVSVFCSQIFTLNLNVQPKVGLTYALYSKVIFSNFFLRKYFYFSLLNLNYWCFTTILWKFQKNWTSGTCWKSGSKLPTLQISAWFGFIFTMEKSDNICFFLKTND